MPSLPPLPPHYPPHYPPSLPPPFFPSLQANELIIPTTDTVRQRFFLECYVTHNKPLLFVGPTGTGKSAITNNYLVRLPKDRLEYKYKQCTVCALATCTCICTLYLHACTMYT